MVCVQKGEHLIIANVGDSKAILFREAAQGASSRDKCVPPTTVELRNCLLMSNLQRLSPALQDQGGDLHDRAQGLLPKGGPTGGAGEGADWEKHDGSPQRGGAQAIRYQFSPLASLFVVGWPCPECLTLPRTGDDASSWPCHVEQVRRHLAARPLRCLAAVPPRGPSKQITAHTLWRNTLLS